MFDPENPPDFQVTRWIGSAQALTLAELRGKVVVVVAFQMLCPGCVEYALPQAKRLQERFNASDVVIIGLHCVFEHHKVMTADALDVFMSEYRWPLIVGIDEADGDGVPKTMAAYQMQGTPTMLIFDRAGRLRRHYFGRPDDIHLAAEITGMALEPPHSPRDQASLIERKLAAILRAPKSDDTASHEHQHGDDCGCGHDHHHHNHHDH